LNQFANPAFLIEAQIQAVLANSTIDITLILSTLGDSFSITAAAA